MSKRTRTELDCSAKEKEGGEVEEDEDEEEEEEEEEEKKGKKILVPGDKEKKRLNRLIQNYQDLLPSDIWLNIIDPDFMNLKTTSSMSSTCKYFQTLTKEKIDEAKDFFDNTPSFFCPSSEYAWKMFKDIPNLVIDDDSLIIKRDSSNPSSYCMEKSTYGITIDYIRQKLPKMKDKSIFRMIDSNKRRYLCLCLEEIIERISDGKMSKTPFLLTFYQSFTETCLSGGGDKFYYWRVHSLIREPFVNFRRLILDLQKSLKYDDRDVDANLSRAYFREDQIAEEKYYPQPFDDYMWTMFFILITDIYDSLDMHEGGLDKEFFLKHTRFEILYDKEITKKYGKKCFCPYVPPKKINLAVVSKYVETRRQKLLWEKWGYSKYDSDEDSQEYYKKNDKLPTIEEEHLRINTWILRLQQQQQQ